METKNSPVDDTSDREIVTTRILNAPRELAFQAWADPKHIGAWWGPRGFTTTTKTLDFKPGGVWSHVMHGPDGRDYPNTITFTEIEKPKRIAYHHSGAEGSEPVSVTFRTIVTFEDLGGKTKITMKGIFNSAEELEKIDSMYGARDGAQQTMDRLVEKVAALSGESTFVISRTFNAQRELMFQVWTDPDHLKKWWTPKDCKVLKAQMDLRPGGIYHYGMQTPDGSQMWGKMVFREIVGPEKLVYVNSFSDENGGLTRHPLGPTWPLETLTTITFLENGGKTTLTIEWTPINATAEEIKTFEDGRPGMLVGWTGSLDLLSGYLSR